MKLIGKYLSLCLMIWFMTAEAGSFFNSKRNGLGLRVYVNSIRGIGMGDTGLASFDTLALNNNAVTQWRFINDTRATFGFSYQKVDTDLNNIQFSTSTTDFGVVNLAVPIQRKKWVIGFTLQPYTILDFQSTEEAESGGVEFNRIALSSGTISRAQMNLVWSPARFLGLSVNGSYYFGAIEDNFNFIFSEARFVNSVHNVQYKLSGGGLGFSMDIVPIRNKLMLAGFADLQTNAKMTVDYNSLSTTPEDRIRSFNSFPLQYGIGSTCKLGSRWSVALDYNYQFWSEALSFDNQDYEDRYQVSAGVELGAKRGRHVGFFNRIDYRGGVSVHRLGYKFNDESVFEYTFHFGLGVPFGLSAGRMDLALKGGLRGDLNSNLAEEKFVNLHLSISIGELWFQQIR